MAGRIETTDILIVGKTGVGKSALGNAILQKKVFKSENSTTSVTKTAEFDYCEFGGRKLKVVDGPGLADTCLSPTKAVELVIGAMSRALCLSHKGFHAILLVVRYGDRFTNEDKETLSTLKKIFGEKFITDHAILVMTFGDNFRSDSEESGQTFEEWCGQQRGVFGNLYTDVQKRAILFENTTKEKDIMHDQIRRLLDMVYALDARYTAEIFEEAKRVRYLLLHGAPRRLVNEEAIKEAALITQQLGRVDYTKPAQGLRQLEDLNKRANLLYEDILKQDAGTNSLSGALKMAQNLKESTAEELENMKIYYDKMPLEESEQCERPEQQSLVKDESQNARMGGDAKIRQTGIENFKPTEQQLQILRRAEEKMIKEKQEAEERERQSRAENRKRREEEQRAEERARKKEQMEKIPSGKTRQVRFEESSKKDECQNAMMRHAQLQKSNSDGRPVRKSAKIRQAEIETFQAAEEKLRNLRLETERMTRKMQEAEERKRQRAGNKNKSEEEKRAEERERQKDELDKKKHQQKTEKLKEEKRKTLRVFKASMAELAKEREKDLQEKVARLEKYYQEVKEESRKAYLEAAPTLFEKILAGLGLGKKGREK